MNVVTMGADGALIVSHDLDFVAAVANRIIVLDGGRAARKALTKSCWRAAAHTRSCTTPKTSALH